MAWLYAAKLAGNPRVGDIKYYGYTSRKKFMLSKQAITDVVWTSTLYGAAPSAATYAAAKALGVDRLITEAAENSAAKIGELVVERDRSGKLLYHFFEN